jgi:hypothetical protein
MQKIPVEWLDNLEDLTVDDEQHWQNIVNSTITLYNENHTKSFKQLRKSRVFKDLLKCMNHNEQLISVFVLDYVCKNYKKKPLDKEIKLRRIPNDDDFAFLQKNRLQ